MVVLEIAVDPPNYRDDNAWVKLAQLAGQLEDDRSGAAGLTAALGSTTADDGGNFSAGGCDEIVKQLLFWLEMNLDWHGYLHFPRRMSYLLTLYARYADLKWDGATIRAGVLDGTLIRDNFVGEFAITERRHLRIFLLG